MIPTFTTSGFLPAGRHHADWQALVARFGNGGQREKLLVGLQQMLNILGFAGCSEVRIGGQFVESRPTPRSFLGVWVKDGVDCTKLPLEIETSYRPQEEIFGGTIVADDADFHGIGLFADHIEKNRDGEATGVIVLDPREVPIGQPFDRYTRFFV